MTTENFILLFLLKLRKKIWWSWKTVCTILLPPKSTAQRVAEIDCRQSYFHVMISLVGFLVYFSLIITAENMPHRRSEYDLQNPSELPLVSDSPQFGSRNLKQRWKLLREALAKEEHTTKESAANLVTTSKTPNDVQKVDNMTNSLIDQKRLRKVERINEKIPDELISPPATVPHSTLPPQIKAPDMVYQGVQLPTNESSKTELKNSGKSRLGEAMASPSVEHPVILSNPSWRSLVRLRRVLAQLPEGRKISSKKKDFWEAVDRAFKKTSQLVSKKRRKRDLMLILGDDGQTSKSFRRNEEKTLEKNIQETQSMQRLKPNQAVKRSPEGKDKQKQLLKIHLQKNIGKTLLGTFAPDQHNKGWKNGRNAPQQRDKREINPHDPDTYKTFPIQLRVQDPFGQEKFIKSLMLIPNTALEIIEEDQLNNVQHKKMPGMEQFVAIQLQTHFQGFEFPLPPSCQNNTNFTTNITTKDSLVPKKTTANVTTAAPTMDKRAIEGTVPCHVICRLLGKGFGVHCSEFTECNESNMFKPLDFPCNRYVSTMKKAYDAYHGPAAWSHRVLFRLAMKNAVEGMLVTGITLLCGLGLFLFFAIVTQTISAYGRAFVSDDHYLLNNPGVSAGLSAPRAAGGHEGPGSYHPGQTYLAMLLRRIIIGTADDNAEDVPEAASSESTTTAATVFMEAPTAAAISCERSAEIKLSARVTWTAEDPDAVTIGKASTAQGPAPSCFEQTHLRIAEDLGVRQMSAAAGPEELSIEEPSFATSNEVCHNEESRLLKSDTEVRRD
ncbi:unnamed protein product [Cyprideis torosa]|uniref:Uncharacterized protein n=1 Tax=Cyprideis torosa TaxID=163714 RepID=A0A7R8W6N6_9CRUS|nr:unnamed protein product [Cyprideis torosa]CAG0886688.1 unnamed protein product [Cyprideis torosa]